MVDREEAFNRVEAASSQGSVEAAGLESLPPMFATRLAAIARRQGLTLEEALAQAIRLDEIVLDTKSRNGKVLLVENGRTFAVNFD